MFKLADLLPKKNYQKFYEQHKNVKLTSIVPEFKGNLLYEGLIKSYSIDSAIKSAKSWTGKNKII